MKRPSWSVLLLIAPAPAPATAQDLRTLTIDDMFAVQRVGDPQISSEIMGGEKDWNVPILNSEQLYQALSRLGRETQLIVYPGEHHGIRRPSFQKNRYKRYLGWYNRYVRGIDAATSDSGTHR